VIRPLAPGTLPDVRTHRTTPPWLYALLAVVFGINAVSWLVAGLNRPGGTSQFRVVLAVVWAVGAIALVFVYRRETNRQK
jgi:hypothetical protein